MAVAQEALGHDITPNHSGYCALVAFWQSKWTEVVALAGRPYRSAEFWRGLIDLHPDWLTDAAREPTYVLELDLLPTAVRRPDGPPAQNGSVRPIGTEGDRAMEPRSRPLREVPKPKYATDRTKCMVRRAERNGVSIGEGLFVSNHIDQGEVVVRMDKAKYRSSLAASSTAMSSASVLESATSGCTRLFQATAPPARWKAHPVTPLAPTSVL